MSTQIIIERSPLEPVGRQRVEIVERKGLGHPDTICDAVADRVSVALARAYRRASGRILHHNIDKCLLVAGQVEYRLGEGRVIEPMRLIIGDRATMEFQGKVLPIAQIALDAARSWFEQNLPHVDADKHIRYQIELKPTSPELGAIFEPRRRLLVANDTSSAVGYAPLSPVERLVIDLERFLNGPGFKAEFPEAGEDVKIMAVRVDAELHITLACPLFVGYVPNVASYFRRKKRIERAIHGFVQRQRHGCKKVSIVMNALDRRGKGLDGMYLTVLGTSAEQGDSGQVGRGNRVSGVISLNRPASEEAAAGKNPVSHVGKIYNVLSQEVATQIHQRVPGVVEATVRLCSTIGHRIDRPQIAAVEVSLAPTTTLAQVKGPVDRILRGSLKEIGAFCEDLAKGKHRLY